VGNWNAIRTARGNLHVIDSETLMHFEAETMDEAEANIAAIDAYLDNIANPPPPDEVVNGLAPEQPDGGVGEPQPKGSHSASSSSGSEKSKSH
jgi:hypothetical protein